MKAFSKKAVIASALILGFGTIFAPSEAEANRSYIIDEFTIKYYKSLLEAKELSKPKESSIEYYTTRTGEEKFAGYKYGKLDDSFAYKNYRPRGIYRGAKGTRRSTSMTNYHTAALTSPALASFKPKAEEVMEEVPEAIEEAPAEKPLYASAFKRTEKTVSGTLKNKRLRSVMMGHGTIHKKQ